MVQTEHHRRENFHRPSVRFQTQVMLERLTMPVICSVSRGLAAGRTKLLFSVTYRAPATTQHTERTTCQSARNPPAISTPHRTAQQPQNPPQKRVSRGNGELCQPSQPWPPAHGQRSHLCQHPVVSLNRPAGLRLQRAPNSPKSPLRPSSTARG